MFTKGCNLQVLVMWSVPKLECNIDFVGPIDCLVTCEANAYSKEVIQTTFWCPDISSYLRTNLSLYAYVIGFVDLGEWICGSSDRKQIRIWICLDPPKIRCINVS